MRATTGSWRALALAFGFWIVSIPADVAIGDEAVASPRKPAPGANKAPAKPAADESATKPKNREIELKLVIAGLGAEGCEVEVKPGNRTVDFKPQTFRVPSNGRASATLKDVELRGVDRYCAFAVVVREKGQEPKTIYRGFRLPSESSPNRDGALSFTCFLSSASRIAELQEADDRTRR